MSKVESVVIGIVLSVVCPFLLMVLFWWSAASIANLEILQITEKAIAVSAITGFAIGIILDSLFVRTWIPRFYAFDLNLMALLYLYCSAIAAAFFMGLPIGNILLGILAGIYIGRRSHCRDHSRDSFLTISRRVGVYTAVVTGLWAVSIGILALDEEIVARMSQALLGITREALTGPLGVVLAVLVGALLAALQYWCTVTASKISYRFGEARIN